MRATQVDRRQPSTGFTPAGEPEYQSAESRAVDIGNLFEVQDDVDFAGFMQCMEPVTKFQISMAQGAWALQVEILMPLAMGR